jgi:lipoprotein signal peptidase
MLLGLLRELGLLVRRGSMSNPLTRRQVAGLAASVGLLLFLLDQASQRWAYQALPRVRIHFNTCHPDSCTHLLGSWLVLKRSISLPLPGGLLTSLLLGALPILVLVVLIGTGGIRFPIHAVAVGLMMGAAASAIYSYLRYSEIERFIAIAYGGRPYTYFNFGIAALLIGGIVFLVGAATGSIRFSRRHRRPRPRRQ